MQDIPSGIESANFEFDDSALNGTSINTQLIDVSVEANIADEAFPSQDWVLAVDRVKYGKSAGWDRIPGDVFKVSDIWRAAAKHLAQEIWDSETIPEEMVLAIMRNLRKPRSAQNDFGGYRSICLLVSTFKLFATVMYL